MFKRRTLFVLGAGASKEVGLPVGVELAQEIRKKMDIRFERGFDPIGDGDFDLFSQVIHNRRDEAQSFQDAAWLIRDGLAFSQSIDDFLDQHRTNEYVNLYGKAAIVKTVLEAEQKSDLFVPGHGLAGSFNPDKCANTWFVKFMYMLGRGVPKEDVRQIFDNVRFIIFNYDRCVEHFLLNALQKAYGINNREAQDIADDLSIIHPYGVVGDVPFGATRANYVQLADGIKTYTEQVSASDAASQIRTEVGRADCIVFLGFSYLSQNIAILQPNEPGKRKPIFGTAFNMSDADVDVVSNNLVRFFNPVPSLQERKVLLRLENRLKCADLFDHYARSLSGGD